MHARAWKVYAGMMGLAVVLAGCVSVSAARLGNSVIRPPVPPDQVSIYLSPAQVPGKYSDVAFLDAAGDYAYTSEDKMFAALRKKAGALGANGVILESIKEPGTGAKVARFFLGTPADRRGKAIAIYVHGEHSAAAN